MWIWAISTTILCILLLGILIAYRRQVKNTCRYLAFLKEKETNLRLRGELPFAELNELADQVNEVLDTTQKLQQEAKHGENNLKEAITNISHDIRTPLTSLDGYFQLLSKAETEEERQQYISVIRGRIESLKSMLEELFTYTKLQNESFMLELEQVDFKKCVCDTLFSFYNDFSDHGISPEVELCEERVVIRGNRDAVQRLIQNVLKNVLEHGSDAVQIGLILVGTEVCFFCENKVEHPEKIDISQVFSRFYRADPARTKSSTGLGLAIAKGLTEKMNGSMKAELVENRFRLSVWFTKE